MKLFVAKLNRDVQDEHLLELFSQYGEVVHARVITDRDTGVSKCFGFVQMKNEADARKAMAELNGKEFMRFVMVVKEAEERPKTGGDSRPSRGAGDGSRPAPSIRSSDSREFSRRPGDAESGASSSGDRGGARPAVKKSLPAKKRDRDIYQDGPRQPKLKRDNPRSTDWFDDLDDE
jgi:RNA recognition motif-containing protein